MFRMTIFMLYFSYVTALGARIGFVRMYFSWLYNQCFCFTRKISELNEFGTILIVFVVLFVVGYRWAKLKPTSGVCIVNINLKNPHVLSLFLRVQTTWDDAFVWWCFRVEVYRFSQETTLKCLLSTSNYIKIFRFSDFTSCDIASQKISDTIEIKHSLFIQNSSTVPSNVILFMVEIIGVHSNSTEIRK